MVKRLVPILITTCAVAGRLMASQQPGSPEIVARRFFDAVSARRWEEAALDLDETSLIEYRDSMLALRRRMPPPREVTVEDLMQSDPAMPREAAEYHIALMQRHRNQRTADPEFPSVPSSDSLARLSGLELAIAWLKGQDQRELFLEDLRQMNCSGVDSLLNQWPPFQIAILGSVVTDTLAFVLFSDPHQTTVPLGLFGSGPLVLELRRMRMGWRIVPRHGLFRAAGFTIQATTCPGENGARR